MVALVVEVVVLVVVVVMVVFPSKYKIQTANSDAKQRQNVNSASRSAKTALNLSHSSRGDLRALQQLLPSEVLLLQKSCDHQSRHLATKQQHATPAETPINLPERQA